MNGITSEIQFESAKAQVSYVSYKPKNQKLIFQKVGDESPCPHIFRRPCCVGAVISRSKGKKAKFPIVIQQNWKPFWKWIELPDRGNYYILWSFRYVNSVPSIVELEGSEILNLCGSFSFFWYNFRWLLVYKSALYIAFQMISLKMFFILGCCL